MKNTIRHSCFKSTISHLKPSNMRFLSYLATGVAGIGLSILPISSVLAGYPNTAANPLYGTANLNTGFYPNPYTVNVTAGGETDASFLNLINQYPSGENCRGFITSGQPDFRVNYSANFSRSPILDFAIQSGTDTTLVVNDPNGNWYCSDDSDGSNNPHLILNSPSSGQYDIWVGVYGSSTPAPAQLRISERVNEPLPTTTSINFCNQTSDPIYTAYAAYTTNNGWRSIGWYRIDAQRCRDISLSQEYRGNVYVYGEYNRGERYWGNGDASLCVNQNDSFNIPYADQAACNGSNFKRVPMTLLTVAPGQNTWTMTAGNNPDPGPTMNPGSGSSSGSGTGAGTQPSNCLVYVGGVCVLEL